MTEEFQVGDPPPAKVDASRQMPRYLLLAQYVAGVVLALAISMMGTWAFPTLLVPPFLLEAWNSDLQLGMAVPEAHAFHSLRIFCWHWVITAGAINIFLVVRFPQAGLQLKAHVQKLDGNAAIALLGAFVLVPIVIFIVYFTASDPLGVDGRGLAVGNLRDGLWRVLFPAATLLVPILPVMAANCWNAIMG